MGLVAATATLFAQAEVASAKAPGTLHVGTRTLRLCATAPRAYCGRLSVPLNWQVPRGPHISIAYRWYPAADAGAGRHTVVPVEGGPGYPSIGSVAGGYSLMYGPLLHRFNLLAVDNRGTGGSTPIDCPALQNFSGQTGTAAYQQVVGACGASLNSRWRYRNGTYVHASDLFTSAAAAQDLAAVIRALHAGRVDLYGDSYGTFFAQSFAARYPHMLRSVILDSTYQVLGLDPWYRSSIQSMGPDFDNACSRSAACAAAAPGSSWARIGQLAAYLRMHPVSGQVPGPEGTPVNVTVNVTSLVNLVSDAAEDTEIYRQLDAAARALLDNGDPSALLRLSAFASSYDENYFGISYHDYSAGLYYAVSCLDYPQLFQMTSSPTERAAQLASAEASLPASTFSPFSTTEWLSMDQNTEAFTACLDWPSPVDAQPPMPHPGPELPSSVPLLALGGEFDTWTPPVGVPAVLSEMGGDHRFIELANSTHVVGEGDTDCGDHLVQEFVADPRRIDSMNASCAAKVPPIRAVGAFPQTLGGQAAATAAGPGAKRLPTATLQLAAAAVSTAGDALYRVQTLELKSDLGLHGGTVTASLGGHRLALHGDQLIPGVGVSGTVVESASGRIHATLVATAAGVPVAHLSAHWSAARAGAVAHIAGRSGGQPLHATMPAP